MSNVIIGANKVTLKGIADRVFLETMLFPKNNPFRMPLSSGLFRLMKNIQDNPLPSGNSMRGLLQAPMPNLVQSFPATLEETPSQN